MSSLNEKVYELVKNIPRGKVEQFSQQHIRTEYKITAQKYSICLYRQKNKLNTVSVQYPVYLKNPLL